MPNAVARSAVLARAFATMMLPAWPFVPKLAVVTVTEVPPFRAAWMLPVVTIALSLVELKLGLAVTLASGPAD